MKKVRTGKKDNLHERRGDFPPLMIQENNGQRKTFGSLIAEGRSSGEHQLSFSDSDKWIRESILEGERLEYKGSPKEKKSNRKRKREGLYVFKKGGRV